MRDARWVKHRGAQERWKTMNRERYLQQKRELASRPAYLAHRRAMYRQRLSVRSVGDQVPLSTWKDEYDVETTDEIGDRSGHTGRGGTESPPLRPWSGLTLRETAEGLG